VDELFEFGQVNGVDLAVHVIQIMSYAVINNLMQDLYLLLFIFVLNVINSCVLLKD
jgi:hypothetical protein